MVARVCDDQIPSCIKDDTLRISQPIDEHNVLFILRGEYMNGIVSQSNHKDIANLIFDHVIGNGESGKLFERAILVQTPDRVAIFISNEQTAIRLGPGSGWPRQPRA